MVRVPVWLLPLRDLLSVVEIGASYWINEVVWRGHMLAAKGTAANTPIRAWGRSTATR
jgi:hypothetical protein